MKRFVTAIMMTAVLGLSVPVLTSAQTRYCDSNGRQVDRSNRDSRGSNRGYRNAFYETNRNGYYNNENRNRSSNRPNIYDRHRKSMNIAIATGAGAIIGALIGGKKGALIGAAAGVAGGAIITKKQKPRNYIRY